MIIKIEDTEDYTNWFYSEATTVGSSERFNNLVMSKANGSLRVQFNSGRNYHLYITVNSH